MIEIRIPSKTFTLYKNGTRTFIHLLRDNESLALKDKLEYGCTVALFNKETEEKIEEIFWFLFDYKENDRFLILVFKWNTNSALFPKRKGVALRVVQENSKWPHNDCEIVAGLSPYQRQAHNAIMAYSALFFVAIDNPKLAGHTLNFLNKDDTVSQQFVIVDVLRLLQKNQSSYFEIYSLFPVNLF